MFLLRMLVQFLEQDLELEIGQNSPKNVFFFFFAGDGVAKPLKRLRGTPFENHCSKPSKHVAAMLALKAPSVKIVTFRV